MNVRCFGIARDIVDADHINIQKGEMIKTVDDLREWIKSQYPAMNKLKSFMIAVNQEYAEGDQRLINNDEIAIIPPVSGG